MKTIILFIIMPFLTINSIHKLDEDNGFGNYKFGAPRQDFKNLSIELDEGDMKLYSATDDYINSKDSKFKYIRLTFFKNKLSAITFQTIKSSGNNLFEYFKENYALPKKIKGHYEWLSKKVQLVYEPCDANDAVISLYIRESDK